MDSAICGYCRCGYFRCNVYRPDWDKTLKQFRNFAKRTAGGITPCVQGEARQDRTRHNVHVALFDELVARLQEAR